MIYKAFFGYFSDETGENYDIPVQKFEVVGGADRQIDLRTTNDISISSELEQARSRKNIVLFIPPTGNHKIMKTTLDLSEFFNIKTKFTFFMFIERHEGKRMLEALVITDYEAHIKLPPHMVVNNLLFVTVTLPKANLYAGKIKKSRTGLTDVKIF